MSDTGDYSFDQEDGKSRKRRQRESGDDGEIVGNTIQQIFGQRQCSNCFL